MAEGFHGMPEPIRRTALAQVDGPVDVLAGAAPRLHAEVQDFELWLELPLQAAQTWRRRKRAASQSSLRKVKRKLYQLV